MENSAGAKNSILIVDDEKSNLKYLNHLLGNDYSIFIAKNGQEAIEIAKSVSPDLILLDILMPGMDGYEVFSALKSYETTRDIPVIFITGLGSNEDEEKGLASGAVDYITKPFSAEVIRFRVQNQIRIINQIRAVEGLSMTDQLTGIPNRRSFDQQLNKEWRRAAREKTSIGILMMDVDRFKIYNDTYGHQQGDAALQAVATTLAKSLRRPADFAARWGGEEFAVLLPVTDIEGALNIAELIRKNIEATIILCADGTQANVTASIGANVQTPAQNDSMDEFIYNADKALYTAKETGRNRVCKS